MEPLHPVITAMRKLINKFKIPYMNEHSGGGEANNNDNSDNSDNSNNTDNNKQNVQMEITDVIKHLNELYMILVEVIKANGVIPKTTDMNKRAVYSVFEKGGVFPGLREDISLKESMLYYATLDLRTYPYTVSIGHIDILNNKGVKPIPVVVGNNLNRTTTNVSQ